MEGPVPVARSRRSKIGLKATSSGAAGVATVESIRFTEDNSGAARVTVRYGPKPKRAKDGMLAGPYPETSDLVIPTKLARQLQVGMKCRIAITPIGGRAYADEDEDD